MFRKPARGTTEAPASSTHRRAGIAPSAESVRDSMSANIAGHSPTSHISSATAGPGVNVSAASTGSPSRSHGAHSTASKSFVCPCCNAAQRPPNGPSPGAGASASETIPPHARPHTTTASHCAFSAPATCAIKGFPVCSASALSLPNRLDSPPASIAPSSLKRSLRTSRARSDSGGSPKFPRRSHTASHPAAAARSDSR